MKHDTEIIQAAVVMPCNSSEVSLAVKFAVSNQIPMTVCGGGHSSSGASSSEGMVIDLRKMRKVRVDTEAMTVKFEGGCLWEDVEMESTRLNSSHSGESRMPSSA